MASTKGRLARLVSRFALERATVQSVQRIGGFVRLHLRWAGKPYAAGAKLQLLLPSDDMRTYTPIPSPDGITLLGWAHGDGPGARWLTSVQADDPLPFAGPQRSLSLDAGPVVIVGDETSVAVAAAFAAERSQPVRAVIQSDAASDVREAAAAVGLHHVDVVPRGDTGATVDAVAAHKTTSPDAIVAVTGGAELVVAVRAALRAAGERAVKTKTYWIPGRTGLD